jgi:predicted AAA+ superfamily ATPase
MYRPVLEDKSWTRNVWEAIGSKWRARWDEEVAACYPFHPMLLAIAKEEWSKVTGFQRVRSTIRIFAAAVYAQKQHGKAGEWVPALIGSGDLPLSDSAVREAILGSGLVEDERTIANYCSLAEIEVVNNDGPRAPPAGRTLSATRSCGVKPTPGWPSAPRRSSSSPASPEPLAVIVDRHAGTT